MNGMIIPVHKLPVKLTLYPPLTDVEFEQMCASNSDYRLERTQEGAITVYMGKRQDPVEEIRARKDGR